jgi:hypothetical protein
MCTAAPGSRGCLPQGPRDSRDGRLKSIVAGLGARPDPGEQAGRAAPRQEGQRGIRSKDTIIRVLDKGGDSPNGSLVAKPNRES